MSKQRFLIFTVVFFFLSCGGKKKEPVAVNLETKTYEFTTGTAGQPGYMILSTGSVFFSDYSVFADRKNGDDINFTRSINAEYDVDINNSLLADNFELIQGEYDQMVIKTRLGMNQGNGAIVLNGFYTDQGLVTFPFQLKITQDIVLETVVKNGSQSSFTLIPDSPRWIEFSFYLIRIFSSVSPADWNSAVHQGGNPNALVKINDTDNLPIYNLILNNLSSSVFAGLR